MRKIDESSEGQATVVAVRLPMAVIKKLDGIIEQRSTPFAVVTRSSVARVLLEQALSAAAPVTKLRPTYNMAPLERGLLQRVQVYTAYGLSLKANIAPQTAEKAIAGKAVHCRVHKKISEALDLVTK